MSKFFSIFVLLMFCGSLTFAQNHRVSGVVTGTDGRPIQGVAVQVEGTTVGTTTNAEGRYEINAPANGTLVFTGVNVASQTVGVDNRTTINVIMNIQTTTLNEVVVTALGISREKKALGYST